ncbi:k+ transporter, NAD-binding protein [Halogeometricum pallidum JCM 14848]|uniref:K+ transporter, NAD-binding protein n=1 Tax=Halogeometricum pallidum JCM 14848 TaxID=1227487 RepID=M0DFK3_HALPD|nr:TrkA C-terminal domain-containing protein [Halogeometricum pallidum]ELZ32944.1 k+ transporter, NAD-binding protein [Halogeometricum pallidum JCM 14848]
MASLPVELLYGLYLGALAGFVPALVAWALGFAFRYFTGITIPGLAVAGLGVAIAGLSGGILALADPEVTLSQNQVRLSVALIIVLMATFYAHGLGDRMGANLPRKLSLRELTARTLSSDVVELVGGRGQVRVSVVGEVSDVEGYQPLSTSVREEMRASEWTFPADVPLVELETRVEDRLRTEFDLAEVEVTLDERARASVAAAPGMSGLSKRLEPGERAVSTTALVPTGTARGDDVTVLAGGESFPATVLGIVDDAETKKSDGAPASATDGGTDLRSDGGTIRSDGGERIRDSRASSALRSDGGVEVVPTETVPTAAGGEARVTLAVRRQHASKVLSTDRVALLVRSRGVRSEFELVTLLRRAGKRFRRLSAREGGVLDGVTLGEATVRDRYAVVVLGVRHEGKWTIAPRGTQRVDAGDDLVVVGAYPDLAAFAEVAA